MTQLRHAGVLGMKWGVRKAQSPVTKGIVDKANKILNNPNATQADLDKAHASIGIDPKTGRVMKTKPVYDKAGNDVSVNPERRFFKPKDQSDKAFDAELKKEMALDADVNPTAANLARRKVADMQEDRQAKILAVTQIGTAAAIGIALYLGQKSLKKSADAAMLAKYGPELFKLLKSN